MKYKDALIIRLLVAILRRLVAYTAGEWTPSEERLVKKAKEHADAIESFLNINREDSTDE
jgi:hypothetical protein